MGIITFIAGVLEEGTEVVQLIQENTARSASNTDFNFWWDGVCLIGIASLLVSGLTILTLYREFNRDRIDKKCQQNMLLDIIRHLYRNKVCTMAMRVKYAGESAEHPGALVYPSEEHYLKMQLLPSDIHLEQYYKYPEKFQQLHNIDLLLRNYNIEIETALMHIKNPEVPAEMKVHDFDTLNFKCGYITTQIIKAMKVMKQESRWGRFKEAIFRPFAKKDDGDLREEAEQLIRAKQIKNINDNEQYVTGAISRYQGAIDALFAEGFAKDEYFNSIFNTPDDKKEFVENLKKDVQIECGKSKSGGDKINMIVIVPENRE